MTTSPQCQVLLSLAHLLQQHSLSYDDEKDLLLNVSVKKATKISNQYKGGINSPSNAPEGEVHLILTGSPRPTFAETNAWLLDSSPKKSPRKNSSAANETRDERAESNLSTESLRGSYSILDNSMDIHPDNNDDHDDDSDVSMANNDEEEEAEEGRGEGGESGAQLLQEYINDCARNESNSSTRNANLSDLSGSPTRSGGSVLSRYRERKNSEASAMSATSDIDAAVKAATDSIEKTNSVAGGPMVGHAVVDAVNQSKGVGLQSSRAKLLQGTIDRPLWDQRRWTDGECLFSELIEKVGLESFENTANVGSGAVGNSADVAAGGVVSRPITGADIIVPEQPTNLGEGLAKSSNLAANLITVPAATINEGGEQLQGLEEGTIDEIARGILRCLKRKKSPPASKLVLVLPPLSNSEKEEQRRQVASARLMAAFQKLEQYNDMIGAPKLMSDAEYEIANVVSA